MGICWMYWDEKTDRLLSEDEVLADWQDNYDGWNETNIMDLAKQYKAVEVNV